MNFALQNDELRKASPNVMSVVITRIGWFVRNTEEALKLAEYAILYFK